MRASPRSARVCGLAALARAELAVVRAAARSCRSRCGGRDRWCNGVVAGCRRRRRRRGAVGRVQPHPVRGPTFLSTNDGLALAGANCDRVYSGKGIGLTRSGRPVRASTRSAAGRPERGRRGLPRPRLATYVGDHLGRRTDRRARPRRSHVEPVPPARHGRVQRGEGREPWVTRPRPRGRSTRRSSAAIGRRGRLWRRRGTGVLWVLLVPVVAVTIGAALTYGQTRFRAAAEPSLAVLAAVAIVALVRTPYVAQRAARARS